MFVTLLKDGAYKFITGGNNAVGKHKLFPNSLQTLSSKTCMTFFIFSVSASAYTCPCSKSPTSCSGSNTETMKFEKFTITNKYYNITIKFSKENKSNLVITSDIKKILKYKYFFIFNFKFDLNICQINYQY